jgi:hypothetical protein
MPLQLPICEPELKLILSVFAAYTVDHRTIEKFSFQEYTTDELIELLLKLMNGNDYDKNRAYEFIVKALGELKIAKITNNIDSYINQYNDIMHSFDHIKHTTLGFFANAII